MGRRREGGDSNFTASVLLSSYISSAAPPPKPTATGEEEKLNERSLFPLCLMADQIGAKTEENRRFPKHGQDSSRQQHPRGGTDRLATEAGRGEKAKNLPMAKIRRGCSNSFRTSRIMNRSAGENELSGAVDKAFLFCI